MSTGRAGQGEACNGQRVAPITSQTYTVAGIEGPEGSDRMYVITAFVPANWTGDYSTLIGPKLSTGEFRRSMAIAGLAGFRVSQAKPMIDASSPGLSVWLEITDVEADWDDESGQVELRFTIATSDPDNRGETTSELTRITAQIVTFAGPPA